MEEARDDELRPQSGRQSDKNEMQEETERARPLYQSTSGPCSDTGDTGNKTTRSGVDSSGANVSGLI